MKVNSHKLIGEEIPSQLRQIYDPPKILYYIGVNPREWLGSPKLGVVGSRKANPYGRQITEKLTGVLAGNGLVIISGLAFGIDSLAHQAALSAGGTTVAILPGPLEQIYPASHRALAQAIINSGGTLISEYQYGCDIRKENFIARNRLIAGLSDALLVPQAASRSGSLHTANFALEQGKTVMAIPGDITQQLNAGSNNLLKTGAVMVTDVADIFAAMNLKVRKTGAKRLIKASRSERTLFELIGKGLEQTEELVNASGLSGPEVSSALSLLEINGHVRADNGHWRVA
jgi:DNA processing protein